MRSRAWLPELEATAAPPNWETTSAPDRPAPCADPAASGSGRVRVADAIRDPASTPSLEVNGPKHGRAPAGLPRTLPCPVRSRPRRPRTTRTATPTIAMTANATSTTPPDAHPTHAPDRSSRRLYGVAHSPHSRVRADNACRRSWRPGDDELGSVRHDAAVTDDEFVERVVAAVPAGAECAGDRAGRVPTRGDHRADSDWDFAVYYRGDIDVSVFDQFGWHGHRAARTRHREPA